MVLSKLTRYLGTVFPPLDKVSDPGDKLYINYALEIISWITLSKSEKLALNA